MTKDQFSYLLLAIILFFIIYIGYEKKVDNIRNTLERNDYTIVNEKINTINKNIDSLLSLNESRELIDSISNAKVININNNYKSIYEKTNDTSFIEFDPIINGLLTRHKQIKLERSY